MHIKILLWHGKNKRGSVNCSTKPPEAQLPPPRQNTCLFNTTASSLGKKLGLDLTLMYVHSTLNATEAGEHILHVTPAHMLYM